MDLIFERICHDNQIMYEPLDEYSKYLSCLKNYPYFTQTEINSFEKYGHEINILNDMEKIDPTEFNTMGPIIYLNPYHINNKQTSWFEKWLAKIFGL